MERSICFSGYRPEKFCFSFTNRQLIFQNLIYEISKAGNYGYTKYYFGAAPGFDLLAANAVVYVKKIYNLELICSLPYEDFYLSEEFNDSSRNEYLKTIGHCKNIINVSGQKNKINGCYM